ncbi:MAG: ATP-binding cassette domain-containing protein, partial [Selenomonadaceae bacterium]|nr:ATP-binding cassette domain-containing protein [Selenomonadaceae bacterium]
MEDGIVAMKMGEWNWLSGKDAFFRITDGEAELYAVYERKSGGVVRKFLRAAGRGDILCSLEDADAKRLHMLVIAVTPLTLRSVSWEDICASVPVEGGTGLDAMLETFLCRPEGDLPTHSRQEDPFGEPMPCPAAEMLGVYGSDVVRKRLLREMRRFSAAYLAHFRREERLDEERLSQFAQTKELLLTNSYNELFQNIIPDADFVNRVEDRKQPPIVHAIREIGACLGIPRGRIRLPADACHLTDRQEILRLIGSSCGLYSRVVDLEEGWHRTDLGPLLVFRDDSPYALLPKSPDRYECIDLEEGRRIPVDDRMAASFSPRAFFFAQKMPEDVDGIWKWFRWTGRLSWSQDWWVLLLCCLIAGFVPVVTPLVTQTVFDDIIPSYDKQAHLLVVQVMLVTAVSGALAQLVQGITLLRIKNRSRQTAESALWLKLLSLPASFFRRYQVGELALRMQGIGALSHQLSSASAGGIFSGIFCFWNLVLMFWYSYELAILAVVIWGIYFLLVMVFSWRQAKYLRKKTEVSGRVSGQVIQILTSLSKFKLRAAEERAFYLWTRRFGVEWKWNRKARKQANWVEFFNQSQTLVLNFCIFYLAMTFFDDGKATGTTFMSQASFLSFYSAMGSFGSSISGLQSGITSIWNVLPSLEYMRPILEEKSEVSEERVPASELSGAISVESVDFRYKAGMPLVLKQISFSVKPGEFLAVVGSSGSGKSTLMRILLGMEKPEKGT